MSATARLNKKKLVDVFMEMFLKHEQYKTVYLIHLPNQSGDDQAHHHVAERAANTHGQVADSPGPEIQCGQPGQWEWLELINMSRQAIKGGWGK